MSAIICPSVLAENPHAYREQMARIEPFAERIQIDLTDGVFAPSRTVSPAQVYWPEHITADIHVMFQKPEQELETLISLHPNLVIVHAEATGDMHNMLLRLQEVGIKGGIALLKDSHPMDYEQVIAAADHVLLFAGDLGHFGGKADMKVLSKVSDVRAINPTAELGWDGGVNPENVPLLIGAGIEVLNVGGFIQRADDPKQAYLELRTLATEKM